MQAFSACFMKFCLALNSYYIFIIVTKHQSIDQPKMREISIFQLYRFNKYETILLHI